MPRFLVTLTLLCVVALALVAVSPTSEAQSESVSVFWQCFYPTCRDLRAVSLTSPTDGWAVGLKGTMLRLQNGVWRPWPAVTSQDLYDVLMVSPDRGWAVGGANEIRVAFEWNGQEWRPSPFSVIAPDQLALQNAPRAVAEFGGRGWLVGERGTAWQFKEGRWELEGRVAGHDLELNALALVAPDAGWAVGGKRDGTSVASSASRLVAGEWRPYTMPSASGEAVNYNGLDFVNPGLGWAVGEYYDPSPVVRDYRGVIARYSQAGEWAIETTLNTPLYSVSALSESQAWAVGWRYGISGPLAAYYQRQFGRWEAVAGPESFAPVDVDVLPGGEGWAVGNNGALLRLQGGQWSAAGPQTSNYLNTVAFNAQGGWAAGTNGVLLRYGGSSWAVATSPTRRGINELALADDTGWAVGGLGTILRLVRGEWVQNASPTTYNLQAVALTDGQTGWAVGGGGTVLRLEAGGWMTTTALVDTTLFDVALTGADGWAVGGDEAASRRAILRLQGGEWTVVTNGAGQPLQAVSLVGNTGWAVGERGTILQLIDGEWRDVLSPTNESLFDVYAETPGLAWAVGQNGTVLQYSEGRWQKLPSVSEQPLLAVTRGPDGGYWAVGGYGAILEGFRISTRQYLPHLMRTYTRPAPTPAPTPTRIR